MSSQRKNLVRNEKGKKGDLKKKNNYKYRLLNERANSVT